MYWPDNWSGRGCIITVNRRRYGFYWNVAYEVAYDVIERMPSQRIPALTDGNVALRMSSWRTASTVAPRMAWPGIVQLGQLQLVSAGVAGIPVGSQADGLRRGAAFLAAPVEPELSTEREAGIRAVRIALAKEVAKPVAPARAYVPDCRRAARLRRRQASTTFVVLKRIPFAGWARH